jgi:hypothetical protein
LIIKNYFFFEIVVFEWKNFLLTDSPLEFSLLFWELLNFNLSLSIFGDSEKYERRRSFSPDLISSLILFKSSSKFIGMSFVLISISFNSSFIDTSFIFL